MSPARSASVSRGAISQQQLVAGAVAEAVVDELEVVDVEEHDGDLGVRPRQRVAEAIEEQHAVGQAGQRVVQRLVADVVFGAALLDRVGEDVRERLHEVDVAPPRAPLGGGRQPEQAPAPSRPSICPVIPPGSSLPSRALGALRAGARPHARLAGRASPSLRVLEHGARSRRRGCARPPPSASCISTRDIGALQRALAESRDGRLLLGAALELEPRRACGR